jgi:hypothetical protein
MKSKLDPASIRKSLRKEGFSGAVVEFPYIVDLGTRTSVSSGLREEIREWLKKSAIRAHAETGEISDVIWDKNWRKFYFKNQEHTVQFKLRFL